MFIDRKDAGQKLGIALEKYLGCDGIVLGIPRGGVEVAYYAAEHLRAELSLIVVRKLPFPDNPEAGFGAIAEDGSMYFQSGISRTLPPSLIQQILESQTLEVQRRIQVLRSGKALPTITGKIVILVDDGIAMGSTMRAAVMLCKKQKVGKIVVAAPVASLSAVRGLESEVDEAVILERPAFFHAVADYYQNWYDVSDREVVRILHKTSNV